MKEQESNRELTEIEKRRVKHIAILAARFFAFKFILLLVIFFGSLWLGPAGPIPARERLPASIIPSKPVTAPVKNTHPSKNWRTLL